MLSDICLYFGEVFIVKYFKLTPARLIAFSFFAFILFGALLLFLPFSANEAVDVSFVDALFTSTSAVCVTGLIAVDTYDTFNTLGQAIVAVLIQVGGLGVTSIGVSLVLLSGKYIDLKQRALVREAWNLSTFSGIAKLVKSVLCMTLCFEVVGALLSFLVFSKDYAFPRALGISIFHSIAAFNNSGFDILGGLKNLTGYADNVLLNLTTCMLIIFGGLGFLVILDIIRKRSFHKLTLHSKIVITTSVVLLAVGTILLCFTEDISVLGAFFFSTSARTAGFSTYNVGKFSNAGLFILTILMFIGASPGSTGGGIKTTTFFVMLQTLKSSITNQHCQSFRRKIPSEVITKAFIVIFLSLMLVCSGSIVLCIMEPQYSFIQNLFEVASAFGTVGLSTGITPDLGDDSKLLLTLIMFIGRVGPLTIASMWFSKDRSPVHCVEEMVSIG